jgi:hypothetical protein
MKDRNLMIGYRTLWDCLANLVSFDMKQTLSEKDCDFVHELFHNHELVFYHFVYIISIIILSTFHAGLGGRMMKVLI